MFEKNFYCISSRIENSGQLYGCFKIGPFHRHQSLTFANALRRTLLADRSRCTLNAIQINDVEHEFSSLIGVRESVVDILLNLEKLVFQIKKPITKPQVAFIHFCGPGILRAQHIYLPSNFKCVIPSQYIATLEVDGKLTLKLFFSPNWNQFQFFIQNLIWLKPSFEKVGSRIRAHRRSLRPPTARGQDYRRPSPSAKTAPRISNTKKINQLVRRSGGNFQKHLKFLFKYRYILHEKIHPETLQKRGSHTWSLPNLTPIFNNRLKIVHYLTNNHCYLQLLSIPFQFLNLKIPISVSATKAIVTRGSPQSGPRPRPTSAKQGSFLIYDPKKSVRQYKKQRMKTNYKKAKAQFLKNRKTFSFQPKFQENFLFLNHSLCAIEKVNYALQSTIFEAEADLFAPIRRREDMISPSDRRTTPKQNILFANGDQQTGRPCRPQSKIWPGATRPQLKCHLKLNSHSHIQRKLSVCSSPHFIGPYSKKAQTTQDLFLSSRPLKAQVQKNFRGFDRQPRSGFHELEKSYRNFPISKNKEFILFEVWTDGSILPQTAILRAINELLLEMFPYSSQISKYQKIHQISNNKPKDLLNQSGLVPGLATDPASHRSGANFLDLSKKSFRERFLNLEIGNFYFDLETYIFLKKRKIHRIIDFFQFLNQKELGGKAAIKKTGPKAKPGIQMTLDQFQIFLHSFIQSGRGRDPTGSGSLV